MRQKRPRSPALRPSEAAMTQRPGGPSEAAFAVAPAAARRRSAKIGTSPAGEKKAAEAVLRHGASSELLPEMADQLWRANPLHRLLPLSWGEITRALVTLSDRSMADPVHATTAAANLGLTVWREAAEIWIGTAARWWGLRTRRTGQAGRRRGRPALRRSGMGAAPLLPAAEAELSRAFQTASRGSGAAGGRSRRTAAACLLSPAVPRRDKPHHVSADQSRGASQGMGDGRRQRRRRAPQPFGRSSPGPAQHDRHRSVRAGQEPRHDSRQGRLSQPPHRAHPLRADDGADLRRAAAVHSAVDQQVLCPRPAAEEQSCPLHSSKASRYS